MDELSDSSSSSWVFVYGNPNPIENPGSDIESDRGTDTSDGISIISESEIPYEIPYVENCSTYNDCLKIDDIHDTHITENRIVCTSPLCIETIEDHDKDWDWRKACTLQNLLSIGVLVSAVLLAFYYSSVKSFKNTTADEPITNFDQVTASKFDEIVDKTISCGCGESPRKVFETEAIKQCVYKSLNNYRNTEDDVLFDTKSKPDSVNKDGTIMQNVVVQNDTDTTQKSSSKPGKNKHEEKHKHLKRKQEQLYLSGEWYINLHKYREKLRKSAVEDNRADWYFKRVNARSHLRRKHNYRPYSD